MLRNKRGISPLIATVLLVGFVILLAVLAWVFFSETVLDFEEKLGAECSTSEAAATKIGVKSCSVDGEKVWIHVENKGQEIIDGFRVRIFDGDEAISITGSDTFEAGDSRAFDLSYDGLNAPDKVQVIPFLIQDKKLVLCEQNQVEATC